MLCLFICRISREPRELNPLEIEEKGEWRHYDAHLECEENPNHFLYPKIENAEYHKENHA
jgi:hypothetical protein